MSVKKIAVIGPESTGKSTLCAQLAQRYKTCWCPEYAREYLIKHGAKYTYEDLLVIAKGQLALEDECTIKLENREWKMENEATKNEKQKMANASFTFHPTFFIPSIKPETSSPTQGKTINDKLLFIDTDLYVMKVWCEYVFGKCHQFILDAIAKRNYDLYLLCDIDLLWIEDELREYPQIEIRKELYEMYKDILINQKTVWKQISGNYEERFLKAIKAVESLNGW